MDSTFQRAVVLRLFTCEKGKFSSGLFCRKLKHFEKVNKIEENRVNRVSSRLDRYVISFVN